MAVLAHSELLPHAKMMLERARIGACGSRVGDQDAGAELGARHSRM